MSGKIINYFLAGVIAVFLAACSGERLSVELETSSETFQMRAAWENYVKQSGSYPFKISGASSGVALSGSGTSFNGALTPDAFEGSRALRKVAAIKGEMAVGGKAVPYDISDTYYFDMGFNLLGNKSNEEYAVVSKFMLPQTARVNDTGVLYTKNAYKDSSRSALLGTVTGTFVLEPDTTTTALLKIVDEKRDISGKTTAKLTEIVRVTPDGAVAPVSQSAANPDGTINITF